LNAIAETLGLDQEIGEESALLSAQIIYRLGIRLSSAPDPAELWLFFVGVSTVFPGDSLMDEIRQKAQTLDGYAFSSWILEAGIAAGAKSGDLALTLRIVRDGVVVDASFSATSDHNTGIQRVVRSAAEHWAKDPAIVLSANLGVSGALRTLNGTERDRLLRWNSRGEPASSSDEVKPMLLVPWRSRVLLPEVPAERRLDGLAVLASVSGNSVSAIGHDAIPLTGRQFVPAAETRRFSRFLAVLKELRLIVGVSRSAAEEFDGLCRSLAGSAQPRARVVARPLPIISDRDNLQVLEDQKIPLVLAVGSKEPRKNQDAVVYCAERLWREGYIFELLLVGSYGWSTARFRSWLKVARKNDRAVAAPFVFSDAELWDAYGRASFTVFPSLEEGFGIPIAESLSRGVPVITSNYGSMAELAADGGCLTVDPRDDEAILAAMRTLLSEAGRLDGLRVEARSRPTDSWKQYADDVMALVRQT